MPRSERLLAMLQSLRNRRAPVTAAALASEFGISERTVYRDLASLGAQGAGIEGAAGLGYVLRSDHFLPPLMLEADEADAVMLGLRFVLRRGDDTLAAAARSAAAKVAAVLPDDVAQAVRLNGLAVAPAGDARPMIGVVRDAIRTERKLAITYTDGHEQSSSRTVWPIALGFFDGAEVLAARCELRQDFRHFRLDRIGDAETLDERLPRPHRLLLAEWHARNEEVEF